MAGGLHNVARRALSPISTDAARGEHAVCALGVQRELDQCAAASEKLQKANGPADCCPDTANGAPFQHERVP